MSGRDGTPRPARPKADGRPGVRTDSPRGASRGASEVRIVGGLWKRSKLPVADRPGLRPTPDRVRETLFNWLGQDLSGWRVLDAFAGSGALGFEAASRGAAQVTLLEKDPGLAAQLRANHKRLDKDGTAPMSIQVADALAWMGRAAPASLDLVLLDPPFAQDLFLPALRVAAPLVVPQGLIYLEAPEALEPPAELGLSLWREGRAGAVHYRLFQRNG